MSKPEKGEYGIVGRPESGYSIKVLSAMRYKCVAHQWMDRFSHLKLYKEHAKVQLIPLVFLPISTESMDFAGANDNNKPMLTFFAKAIGETNPVCTDEPVARQAGYRSLPAPPTQVHDTITYARAPAHNDNVQEEPHE